MLIRQFIWFACFALLTTAGGAFGGDGVGQYLTKEGKLDNVLEIKDLQGGFAGFTGVFLRVAVDGTWSSGRVFNDKITEEKNGKLEKADLATLAKALAACDLVNLKNHGEAGVNPRLLQIKFGEVEVTLSLSAGANMPKIGDKKGVLTVEQRFAGVWQAVREALGIKASDAKAQELSW